MTMKKKMKGLREDNILELVFIISRSDFLFTKRG